MKVLRSDEIYGCIERLIKEAKESVKISSAWLKGEVIEELLKGLSEGVELEVVLRASELQDLMITDEKVFEGIRGKGGTIYLNSRLHAKFIVVDGKKAVVGSANFTSSGLSDYSQGNIEAGVYYEVNDDPEEIKKLLNYFERIKADSFKFDDSLLGFAMNPVKSRSFEFVLLEDVKEQSYVEVKGEEGVVLGRLVSIYSYDMGFFANPFTAGESPVFGSIDTFKTLFAERKSKDWKKAAVWSYLNDNGKKVKIAVVDVVGVVKDGKLETPLKPFDVGAPVYSASEESLRLLMKKNFSGKEMECPVKVGVLEGSDIEAFIDAVEVITKHMLVLGTTGSGKSYFAKLFLYRFVRERKAQIFILDPHGEYFEALKKWGVTSIERVLLEDTIFPVYPEEVEELIKGAGYQNLVLGNTKEGKENKPKIMKFVKPSLQTTAFSSKNLADLFKELKADEEAKKELLQLFKGLAENQEKVYKELKRGLESKEQVVIFDFSKVTEPRSRVNLAGLIMQELFNQNKQAKEERLLVLEEAHNFAPEVSYGDVSAGKENLALTMARKIASEGRKFKLGLLVITQRPAQVSKYVLSQANTQVMFRTMNSSDLDAIMSYVEFTRKDIVELLPSFQTGTAVVSGLGAPFPFVVNVK